MTRNIEIETALTQAITAKVRVILRYDNGTNDRTFEPQALFYATKDRTQVAISGTQVRDAAKPAGPARAQVFDVAKITRITPTKTAFKADPRFNRLDKTYAHGIICYAQ